MKKLIVSVTLILFAFLGTSYSQDKKTGSMNDHQADLKIKRAVQKMEIQELERSRSQMSFKDCFYEDLSAEELNRLADGQMVNKKSDPFFIPVSLNPTGNISEIQKIDTYVNQGGVVSKTSKVQLGKVETAMDIAILSFYLPLLLMLSILLVHCRAHSSKKIDLTIFAAISNLLVLVSFILGMIFSSLATNGTVSFIIVLTLLIIVVMDSGSKTERTLAVSGIIAGTSVGIFTGRIIESGFGVFSFQMALIWEYVGLYLLASIIGLIFMWKTESTEEPIYIR